MDMEFNDNAELTDAMHAALELAEHTDGLGVVGYGIVELRDGDGKLKSVTPFGNLITDVGDLYYATKVIVGISPANTTAPTAVTGMKLGTTSSTGPAKAGTGAALQAYLSGSNIVFDTSGGPYPNVSNLGTGLGVNAVYKTTWAAGTATSATIVEAVIVTDQSTNATSGAPATIARCTFSTQNKGASDSLAITWNHKLLGA